MASTRNGAIHWCAFPVVCLKTDQRFSFLVQGISKELRMNQNNPLILFMLLPETGAYNASLALARRLREQGYRILYGGPERFEEHVQAQGFAYERLEVPEPEFIKTLEGQPQPGIIGRWQRTRKIIRYYRRESRALMDLSVARFAEINPALVLFDPLVWPYAELPLRSGVPIVSFSTTLASYFNLQVPPVFSDIPAGDPDHWQVRLLNLLAWSRCILKARFNLFIYEKILPLFYGLLPQASGIKRIRQLGATLCWGEYGPRLIGPELVVAPKELDFPQLVASNERTYIGACVDVARSDGEFDWSDIDQSKLLVYCSLGTYSSAYPHAYKLFSSVIDALKQRPDLQGIVQIGDVAAVDDFGDLPINIKLVKRVPQIEVLSKAKLFITHGGFSSTRESLFMGVPMLVFPCWLDQPGNAARVVHHGVGLQGDIACVSPPQILDLLRRVEDPSFTVAARKMQVSFAEQADCQAGVDFINAYLKLQPVPRAVELASTCS
jgi:zeaxanthin glucosyltransferase